MAESTNQDLKNKFECLKEELDCAYEDIGQMKREIDNKNVTIEHLQDVNDGLSLEIEVYKGKVQAFQYCIKCLGGKE